VSVDDLKAHLRLLDDDSEDDVLAVLATAARETFEDVTRGRIVLPTVFRQSFTGWPCSASYLALGVANVSAVASVMYTDPDGEEQTLDNWSADLSGCPALVYLDPGESWPALSCSVPRPVRVQFTAGWPNVDAVPAAVLLGLRMLCGNWYSNRESHGAVDLKATPYGFDRLCQMYSTGLGVF
jgi:uncharacterized phiE125 gp8 family phage protein